MNFYSTTPHRNFHHVKFYYHPAELRHGIIISNFFREIPNVQNVIQKSPILKKYFIMEIYFMTLFFVRDPGIARFRNKRP